jgi:hypothetical protein
MYSTGHCDLCAVVLKVVEVYWGLEMDVWLRENEMTPILREATERPLVKFGGKAR